MLSFRCEYSAAEKKNSTQNEYGSLENYYANITNDITYTEIQRNIAEEFKIKSKVKLNHIEEAISDYNSIYTQNINTSKGTHVFINKEILLAGADDNMSGHSVFENIEISQNAINSVMSNVINKNKNIFTGFRIQPEEFLLSQNYPNPFNPKTIFKYIILFPLNKGGQGVINLKIYDVLGKEVVTLINEKQNAGSYEVEFNRSNLPSGVYFYKLETPEFTDKKRMVLIK